jgi:hypothetical protein
MGKARIETVFIGGGLIFLLLGMAFGMWMGVREDFQLADAHAHLNLVGFVIPTLYGLIHRAFPGMSVSRLAWPQLVVHFVGALIMIPGIVIVIRTGHPAFAIAGAMTVILATVLFAFIFATADKSR